MFGWGLTASLLVSQSVINYGASVRCSTTLFNSVNEVKNGFEFDPFLLDASKRFAQTLGPQPTLNASMSYFLGKHGYIIIDDFIDDKNTLQKLSADVTTLLAEGRFRTARVGHNSESDSNIRLAEHCFLHNRRQDDAYPNVEREATLERIAQLRNELSLLSNQPLDPELDDLLYVYYPNGGFYVRHVDATPGTPTFLRQFSILLYLNTNEWTDCMGGQLRLFLNDVTSTSERSIDILPLGGRLVIFESDRIPHQVLETNQERRVLVGWFNRAPTAKEMVEFMTKTP